METVASDRADQPEPRCVLVQLLEDSWPCVEG